MVFISEGMGVRIPAGGLSISLGPVGEPQASLSKLEVAYEVWPDWVDIAIEHAEDALLYRQRLAELVASNTDQPQARAMTSECRASMVAVTASVTAVDAFYAGVSQRLPDYEAAIGRQGTFGPTGAGSRARHSSQGIRLRAPAQASRIGGTAP